MRETRRVFLREGARLSAATLLAELAGCRTNDRAVTRSSGPSASEAPASAPRGDQTPAPSATARALPARGDAILELPEGFTSYVLDRAGDPMSDGYRVPGAPDGMAIFEGPDGTLVLMRNHELTPGDRDASAHPGRAAPELAYDRASHGAVTRVVVRPDDLSIVTSNLALTGTNRNCSCGPAPFGFLTCEEDVADGHGYVFLCDPKATALARPRRIDAYGRFYHESIAVDPRSMIAYMTEDLADGAFYRFVPRAPEDPFEGRLEALAIDGDADAMKPGERREVRWVEVPPDASKSLRQIAQARGATRFKRGEGMVLDLAGGRPRVHFCTTAGGPIGRGQIFTLDVGSGSGGSGGPRAPGQSRAPIDTLVLVATSTDAAMLDMPDNIAALPNGSLLACEDGGRTSRIRGITPNGKVFDVARSRVPGELTGVAFDARHELLFVNQQRAGVTLAIRGPFARLTS